jgi:hypothetical protein
MMPLEYRRIMDSKENEKKKELSITTTSEIRKAETFLPSLSIFILKKSLAY